LKITFLTGELKLQKEFTWIGRKTIRGLWFNSYEYFVSTPYLKITCESEDAAHMMKFRFDHVQ
jgi:hypothetical protein